MHDGQTYWIKPLHNAHGNRSLVTEQIVSRAAALIDAPVAAVAVVEIGEEFAGERYAPGQILIPGPAHASRNIPGVNLLDRFTHRARDANADRQAALIALWDWCLGGDPQWLYQVGADLAMYSFDHGMWFGTEGGGPYAVPLLGDSVRSGFCAR